MNTYWKILLYFLCFTVGTALCSGFNSKSSIKKRKKTSYLSERLKKQYKEISYEKLIIAPKRFRAKRIKFHITFKGPDDYISYYYKEKLPGDRYFYFDVGTFEEKLPIIYNRKSKKRLTTKLLNIEKGTDIIIYGKIKTLRKFGYDSYTGKKYYFYVDDIDISGEGEEDADNSAIGKIEISAYKPVKTKNLDLLANKYINKKIRLAYTYKGRMPEIDYPLQRIFQDDQYFQLTTRDRFDRNILGGFAFICKKNNSKLVEKVISLKEGEKVYVYGTLKKMSSKYSSKRAQYYIIIDAISKIEDSVDIKF